VRQVRQVDFHKLAIADKPAGWSTEYLPLICGPQSASVTGDLILARAQLYVCGLSNDAITTSAFLSAFNTLADCRAEVGCLPERAERQS
jgi:hypothetical protein